MELMGWRDVGVRGENENLAFADSFGRPSTQTHNKEFFKSSFDNEHATYHIVSLKSKLLYYFMLL